ncbi:MAG: hypothetical protein Q9210_003434 [Variospora velana]
MANVVTVESTEERLTELNDELTVLIEVFPHILPEVFREVLIRFDGESRLEAALNSLLKNDELWVKGRLRPIVDRIASDPVTAGSSRTLDADKFRSNSYKWAVRVNLTHEFKSLSKSTVQAVLAEKNHSYTLARPVLQGIASKNWRRSIGKFFSRWSKSTGDVSEKHGMIQWTKAADGSRMPILRETGDAELDQELYQTLLAPLLARYRAQQEANDEQVAEQVNLQEAISADALFECGCCFGSTIFERMASCTESLHTICFECMSRAITEALYGQSWGQTVDSDRGLLRCLVPTADDTCPGCIPSEITRRAVIESPKGLQSWLRFESRLREESLTKAQIPLVRCPPWLDPHTCSTPRSSAGEPTSLRTAIESARTAALKRTCPRCNTSFIKDSGCNKLTCVCGYSMCYVCRQGLGEREGGEGYRHFCQHFRVQGGRCGECESCDLYGGDDGEAEKVELAGKKAEKEWRERWSLMKNGGRVLAAGRKGKQEEAQVSWSLQGAVDRWVSRILDCKERPLRREPDEADEG